jgi:phage-related protein
MPTIKDSLYFNFDGISCKTYSLMNVNTGGSGMFEETFNASRSINETKVRGSDTPLFGGVDEDPLQFTLNIAFTKQQWTDSDIDNIIVWLFQDVYKPLYFEDKPNKIYYCIPTGDASIAHNGLKQGYLTLTMRCKSSKVYSPQQTSQLYDLSTNAGHYAVNINNTGHVDIYPEISITKIGDGNVTFTNNGEVFEIMNLTNLEQIYINCEREIIETDAVGVYRYDDVVGDYFDMVLKRGNNTIYIDGNCKVQFKYMFKYKF